MSKTSSKVKRKWNNAHYDIIYISVKKGDKGVLKGIAELEGKSLNAWILEAINQKRGG